MWRLCYRYNSDDQDNFGQATLFWKKTLNEQERTRLVNNIVGNLSAASPFIQVNITIYNITFTFLHILWYRESIEIVKETDFEILVEISVLGSPELKKVFFFISVHMQRWRENYGNFHRFRKNISIRHYRCVRMIVEIFWKLIPFLSQKTPKNQFLFVINKRLVILMKFGIRAFRVPHNMVSSTSRGGEGCSCHSDSICLFLCCLL